jgi:hypothetical protein
MGMDLISAHGGYFTIHHRGWSFLLSLAEAYGWQPAGTLPPLEFSSEEWRGGYFSNDGQLVTSEDAHALAKALQLALDAPEGPESWEVNASYEARSNADRPGERKVESSGRTWYKAGLTEDDLTHLRNLIKFCRRGSFAIV